MRGLFDASLPIWHARRMSSLTDKVAFVTGQRARVIRLALVLGGQRDAQLVGSRQAAGVGGQDALATTFHRGPAGPRL